MDQPVLSPVPLVPLMSIATRRASVSTAASAADQESATVPQDTQDPNARILVRPTRGDCVAQIGASVRTTPFATQQMACASADLVGPAQTVTSPARRTVTVRTASMTATAT